MKDPVARYAVLQWQQLACTRVRCGAESRNKEYKLEVALPSLERVEQVVY